MIVSHHWRVRVIERIGPDVDPEQLAAGIIAAIEAGRTDLVAYAGRVSRSGLRLFRFRLRDGRQFLALVNTETSALITVVMPEGFRVSREGRPAVNGEAA